MQNFQDNAIYVGGIPDSRGTEKDAGNRGSQDHKSWKICRIEQTGLAHHVYKSHTSVKKIWIQGIKVMDYKVTTVTLVLVFSFMTHRILCQPLSHM